jgi:hypothetical protein
MILKKVPVILYLGDAMAGYFAEAGVMAAYFRRSIEGGSYHGKISFARNLMWAQELGFIETNTQ